MDRKEFNKIVDEFMGKSANVLKSKSHDYAEIDDVLINFKRVTKIAKEYRFDFSNLHEYGLFMCVLKIDRIMNLTKGNKSPNNESVQDSFIDLFNYVLLSHICYIEGKNGRA